MKHSLFLILFTLSSSAFAQLSPESAGHPVSGLVRGTWQVGLSVGRTPASRTSMSRADAAGYTQVQPRVQYVVRDNWSVGIEGRFQPTSQQKTYRSIGITSRHYLLKTRNIAAFGQVGYFRGQPVARQYTFDKTDPAHPTLSRQESRPSVGTLTIGAGIQYRLGKRWSAEVMLEHQDLGNHNQMLPCSSRWQGNIGLNYRIGR